MAFEYVPGNTFFHRLDPRVKIALIAAFIVMAVSFSDPIWLGCVYFSLLMIIRYCKLPWDRVKGFLKGITLVVAVYMLFNTIYPPVTLSDPLIFFYLIPPSSLPISLDGIVWAIGAVVRFLIILTLLRVMLMITPMKQMILALVKFGLPPEFGLALTTGFGYLPVLADENQKIMEAQQARGFRYGYRNPIKKFKALFTQLLIPAISNSMRRTQDIAIAIESKGFSYDPRSRTYMHSIKFQKTDYVTLAVTVFILVFAVLARPIFGWANYTFTLSLIKNLML